MLQAAKCGNTAALALTRNGQNACETCEIHKQLIATPCKNQRLSYHALLIILHQFATSARTVLVRVLRDMVNVKHMRTQTRTTICLIRRIAVVVSVLLSSLLQALVPLDTSLILLNFVVGRDLLKTAGWFIKHLQHGVKFLQT